jgi:hypothetical protein
LFLELGIEPLNFLQKLLSILISFTRKGVNSQYWIQGDFNGFVIFVIIFGVLLLQVFRLLFSSKYLFNLEK